VAADPASASSGEATVAVISDIHANLEALRAVLADIRARGAAEILCLGDNVGYGGDPEAVVGLLRSSGVVSIMGNHELGLTSDKRRRWFNPLARQALARTAELLSAESLAYLTGLPRVLIRHGARLVHGTPPESTGRYLFEYAAGELPELFARFPEELCFVGHTHELVLVTADGSTVRREEFPAKPVVLPPGTRAIVNAGAVGQPRDGDPRAKYILWWPLARRLEVRRVPYDTAAAAARIRDRGMPEQYARILEA